MSIWIIQNKSFLSQRFLSTVVSQKLFWKYHLMVTLLHWLTSVLPCSVSDGRGWQKVCQEEAREPEPGSGPGHRALLPVCYVRPQGHVQEEDQDHWDQGEDRALNKVCDEGTNTQIILVNCTWFWYYYSVFIADWEKDKNKTPGHSCQDCWGRQEWRHSCCQAAQDGEWCDF